MITRFATATCTDRSALQWRLLGLVAVGFIGTGAELVLLDHMEGFWQKLPFGLIALSLLTMAVYAFSTRSLVTRSFQGAMLLAIAGGITGLVMHFRGNMEFELEMHPNNSGWPLLWKTLKGATPALAPGMMIFLGLLGLAATSRRPQAEKPSQLSTTTTTHGELKCNVSSDSLQPSSSPRH